MCDSSLPATQASRLHHAEVVTTFAAHGTGCNNTPCATRPALARSSCTRCSLREHQQPGLAARHAQRRRVHPSWMHGAVRPRSRAQRTNVLGVLTIAFSKNCGLYGVANASRTSPFPHLTLRCCSLSPRSFSPHLSAATSSRASPPLPPHTSPCPLIPIHLTCSISADRLDALAEATAQFDKVEQARAQFQRTLQSAAAAQVLYASFCCCVMTKGGVECVFSVQLAYLLHAS